MPVSLSGIIRHSHEKSCMAREKTAVELTKGEPIGYSKISLNPDSVHCICIEAQKNTRSSKSSKLTPFTSNNRKTLGRRGSGNVSLGYITGDKIGHDRTVLHG